jgi:hypothetical protein
MINELDDDESDGDTTAIPRGMPVLMTLSTEHADQRLKTLRQRNMLVPFYVDIFSPEDCTALLTELVHTLDDNAVRSIWRRKGGNPRLGPETMRARLLSRYKCRMKIVGPIPSTILGGAAYMEARLKIEHTHSLSFMLKLLGSWNIDHNPEQVRHFAAARLRPGVIVPRLDWGYHDTTWPALRNEIGGCSRKEEESWRIEVEEYANESLPIYQVDFLSDYIREKVRLAVTTEDERIVLSKKYNHFLPCREARRVLPEGRQRADGGLGVVR